MGAHVADRVELAFGVTTATASPSITTRSAVPSGTATTAQARTVFRHAAASVSSRSTAATQPVLHLGHADLVDDVGEEAADDQPARLVLGDAAGLQVEQLLVVEPAGRAGVTGADDLAGLDLQVGHRVGAGAVGEHQVAVELVGVGALGRGRMSTSPIHTACASSPCSAPL